MLLPLDPHQIATVEYALKHPYSIFALEMGLGKSACALATWEKVGGRLLIICPAYLILNWKNEIRKFRGAGPVVAAITSSKAIYNLWDADVAIISYDLAQKAKSYFEWAEMIVIDEATYLKSMKAKRTDAIHKGVFENSTKRVHLLTGTPIKNRVEEYYSLIALCNYNPQLQGPKFLEKFPDVITFADHFSNRREYKINVGYRRVTVVKWEGVRNPEELKSYLKDIYIRFKDVIGLSPVLYKDIPMADAEEPELLKAFEAFTKENKNISPTLKAQAALKKVPFTAKYVKDLLEEVGSVVVYTDHVQSCLELGKLLDAIPITGQTPMTVRSSVADGFQKGELKVIVATIGSFSTGITLTASNNLVFNDYPWVPGDMAQAVYRINRRGQTKRCVVHRILGSPQDQYILNAIEDKQLTIDKVM